MTSFFIYLVKIIFSVTNLINFDENYLLGDEKSLDVGYYIRFFSFLGGISYYDHLGDANHLFLLD